MPMLVCAGACNPMRAELDTHIMRSLPGRAGDYAGVAACDQSLASLLRQLRHTRHAAVAFSVYACTVCGTERQWGNG